MRRYHQLLAKLKAIKEKPVAFYFDFYESRAWKELRYETIRKHGGRCQACGVSGKDRPLQVDHIKPRSKFPKLELDPDNLQVLCRDCNLGKSNLDDTDWR